MPIEEVLCQAFCAGTAGEGSRWQGDRGRRRSSATQSLHAVMLPRNSSRTSRDRVPEGLSVGPVDSELVVKPDRSKTRRRTLNTMI